MHDLREMVYCCVILHNMTQEVRREDYTFSDELELDKNASGPENNTVEFNFFAEEGNQVDAATEEVLV